MTSKSKHYRPGHDPFRPAEVPSIESVALGLIRSDLERLGHDWRLIQASTALGDPYGWLDSGTAVAFLSTEHGLGGGDWWPSEELQAALQSEGLFMDSINAAVWLAYPIGAPYGERKAVSA